MSVIIKILFNILQHFILRNESPNTDPDEVHKGIILKEESEKIKSSEEIVEDFKAASEECLREKKEAEECKKEKEYEEQLKVFEKILKKVLEFEGGYVNHPHDPGGETNKGITKKVYDAYRKTKNVSMRSVKYITDDEVKEIYYLNYWQTGKCNKLPKILSCAHFDSCVNHGLRQSALFLQRSIDVKDDGVIGPITLERANKSDYNIAMLRYINLRDNFYHMLVNRNENLGVFLRGWLRRIKALKAFIEKNIM